MSELAEKHKSRKEKENKSTIDWKIEECSQYTEEFEDIKTSNPDEVTFVDRALREMLTLKELFAKSRYVKNEGDGIFEIRMPEGSRGQFRGYFIVDNNTFKFKLAKLKKKQEFDKNDKKLFYQDRLY